MNEPKERKRQYKKISAEVTNEFFQQLDNRAHALKISKSELIRRALFNEINGK